MSSSNRAVTDQVLNAVVAAIVAAAQEEKNQEMRPRIVHLNRPELQNPNANVNTNPLPVPQNPNVNTNPVPLPQQNPAQAPPALLNPNAPPGLNPAVVVAAGVAAGGGGGGAPLNAAPPAAPVAPPVAPPVQRIHVDPEIMNLYNQGIASMNNRRYDEAVQTLEFVLGMFPSGTDMIPTAQMHLGFCKSKQRQLPEAVTYWRQAIQYHLESQRPACPRRWCTFTVRTTHSIVRALLDNKDAKGAAETMNPMMSDPNAVIAAQDPACWQLQGDVQAELKEYKSAIDSYRAALPLLTADEDDLKEELSASIIDTISEGKFHEKIEKMYLEKEGSDTKEVLQLIDQVIAMQTGLTMTHPFLPEWNFYLGGIKFRQKQYVDAIKHLKYFTECKKFTQPTHAEPVPPNRKLETHLVLGESYLEIQNWKLAEEQGNKAIALKECCPSFYLQSRALEKLGNLGMAWIQVTKAMTHKNGEKKLEDEKEKKMEDSKFPLPLVSIEELTEMGKRIKATLDEKMAKKREQEELEAKKKQAALDEMNKLIPSDNDDDDCEEGEGELGKKRKDAPTSSSTVPPNEQSSKRKKKNGSDTKKTRKMLGMFMNKLEGMEKSLNDMAKSKGVECVTCCLESRSVRFQCKHVCVCERCSNQLSECPMCRAQITERLTVFLN